MKAYLIYKQFFDQNGQNEMIGGIETYIKSLFGILLSNNYQPEMIQCSKVPFIKKYNDSVIIRGLVATGKNYQKKLYNQIKKNLCQQDLVIFCTDSYSPKVNHPNTLALQHGIDFDYYPMEDAKRRLFYRLGAGRLIKFFQRHRAFESFRKAKYRVCVDYNFWNWYRTFSLPHEDNNIFVIPNFATPSPIPPRRRSSSKLKVVFARRFERRRGIETLIEAVKELNDKRYDIDFTFAGDGRYINKIQDLVNQYSNVHLGRYLPNKAIEYHQNFDVALVPTLGSEGTSFSLLEAMASGVAVICTPVGGMSNLIFDGFNGIFISPGSTKSLVDAIEKLYLDEDLRMSLSKNALNVIDHAFSKEIWIAKWNNVIKKILNTTQA